MTPEEQTTITLGLDALTEQLRRVNAALEELLTGLGERREQGFLEGRAEERYYETGKWPGETK